MAVRRRHTKVARRLLQLGADVHRFTSCYSNALHHAVHNEDAPMLKVLLEDRNRFLEVNFIKYRLQYEPSSEMAGQPSTP